MSWIDAELALIAVGAMLSPTTLTFSVLALVLGERPLRTGCWFYVGAFAATVAVGIAGAFVLGDTAASRDSSPKTWVAIFDVVAAALLLGYVARTRNRPLEPAKVDGMVARMSKVASSPAVAIVGAGAVLANPGAFLPLALKSISETDPSTAAYAVDWLFFTLVSLLPLSVALLLLVIAPTPTKHRLESVRAWLERYARVIGAVIVCLLALSLLRNGIAGLTG